MCDSYFSKERSIFLSKEKHDDRKETSIIDLSKYDDTRDRDAGGKKLYIGNLNIRAEERDLEDIFGKFGDVDDIYIPRDKSTWLGRGFAFVTYKDTEDAQEAARKWDGRRFQSKKIAVNLARARPEPKGHSPQKVKKYVPSRDDDPSRGRGRRRSRSRSRSRSRGRRRRRSPSNDRRRRSNSHDGY